MNAEKKFIVWDWNGTLLNDTDAVLACVNKVLQTLGHPAMPMDVFQDIQARPLDIFYRAAGLNEEDVARALELEGQVFTTEYETMSDKSPLHQGATEILHQLTHHNVANIIVSNHITSQISRLLKNHEIEDFFETVVAYAGHGKQYRDKTKGAKLRDYMIAKGMNGANALIVGDTIEEIDIAREMGMASVSITGGLYSENRLRAQRPDYVINSLHEMQPILQERGFTS